MSICNSTLCIGGQCVQASSTNITMYCQCFLGFTGGYCEGIIGDLVPNEWVAFRVLTGIIYFGICIVALSFCARYWFIGKVSVGSFSREMFALLFSAASALLGGLAATNHWRHEYIRNGIPLTPAQNAGSSVIFTTGLACLACSFSILLSHWVTIKTAKKLGKGWNIPGKVAFTVATALNLVLAIVMPVIGAYYLSRGVGLLIFEAYLMVFVVGVAVYIIISGVTTLKHLKVFDDSSHHAQVKKVIFHLLVVAAVAILCLIILVVLVFARSDDMTPSAFVWGYLFAAYVVQAIATTTVLWIFYPRSLEGSGGIKGGSTPVPPGMKRCVNAKHSEWFPAIKRVLPLSSFGSRKDVCKKCTSNGYVSATDRTDDTMGTGMSGMSGHSGSTPPSSDTEERMVVL